VEASEDVEVRLIQTIRTTTLIQSIDDPSMDNARHLHVLYNARDPQELIHESEEETMSETRIYMAYYSPSCGYMT